MFYMHLLISATLLVVVGLALVELVREKRRKQIMVGVLMVALFVAALVFSFIINWNC